MRLNRATATALVDHVICQLAKWPRLHDVAFQLGGWEEKAAPQIMSAMEAWATVHHPGFCPVREYHKIDIAFVASGHVGAYLPVSTLVEIKFNFAAQVQLNRNREPSLVVGRLREALCQLGKYLELLKQQNLPAIAGTNTPYILYCVADQHRPRAALPQAPRNSGWGYLDVNLNRTYAANVRSNLYGACQIVDPGLRVLAGRDFHIKLGQYDSSLWVFLIEVPQQLATAQYSLERARSQGKKKGLVDAQLVLPPSDNDS